MLNWLGLLLWSLTLALAGLRVQAQMPAPARDAEVRLVVVNSDSTAAYANAAQFLMDALVRAGVPRHAVWQMSVAELAALQQAGQMPRPRIFVALGTEAASTLAQAAVQTPVLSALIPRGSFERVLRNSGRRVSSQFTALYLDQPLARQLALLRLALPKVRRVGVLWGPASAARAAMLRALATSHNLTLVEARVDTADAVFEALKPVLEDSDVLLAVADPQVYNSSSIQNILLSAFRAQVPMLGFSPAYVRAGALLGLHATPEQAGLQAAALALEVLQNKPLPATALESNDFEVTVNQPVARAFNLSLDGKALRLELRRSENLP